MKFHTQRYPVAFSLVSGAQMPRPRQTFACPQSNRNVRHDRDRKRNSQYRDRCTKSLSKI